ncbi:helix-turn-helix transcriptional regulator [Pseudomaricurvus alcaniphilus]|uniref:winged helix-turn-helix transcriptional regulator n=1 Tax=Pseudomaricurvus alcaniphilus TaxID=1166482 RepID=UPI00140AD0D4|nr:helix-turn-helix domain-containing protein [Pseudomaricurvus alcaniphilus]NHN39892.1 helix-turn-helix transcriptional regulator [Pseudomaricurvus alcaniphilus]
MKKKNPRKSNSNDTNISIENPTREEDLRLITERLEKILSNRGTRSIASGSISHIKHIAALQVHYGGGERGNIISAILSLFGNYWSSAILTILQQGELRPSTVRRIFSTLTPQQPISQRMLTYNLRLLEEYGLVERTVLPSRLAHVEYRLTKPGREISTLIDEVIQCITENSEYIINAMENVAEKSI